MKSAVRIENCRVDHDPAVAPMCSQRGPDRVPVEIPRSWQWPSQKSMRYVYGHETCYRGRKVHFVSRILGRIRTVLWRPMCCREGSKCNPVENSRCRGDLLWAPGRVHIENSRSDRGGRESAQPAELKSPQIKK